MTTKYVSGTITNGYSLSAGYARLFITTKGRVDGAAGTDGAGGVGVTVASEPSGRIVNNLGRVDGGAGAAGASGGGGGAGLYLAGGGTLSNTGVIAGGAGGQGYAGAGGSGGVAVILAGGGSILNNGTILGGAAGYGSYVGSAAGDGVNLASGGAVDNYSRTSVITGASGLYAGTAGSTSVTNYGTINGTLLDGASLEDGGMIINGGTAAKGALISGAQNGVYGLYQAVDVLNYAAINGLGAEGVQLFGGGSVVNGATSAVISGYFDGVYAGGQGATVTNAGTIQGVQFEGVLLDQGGAVTNGFASARAKIAGAVDGVYIGGGVGTISNYGTITGQSLRGVVLTAGGTIVNGSAASPQALISGDIGAYFGGGARGTLINFGVVRGTGGTSVYFQSARDTLVAEGGSSFVGLVVGGGGALELASGSGTIAGLGATGQVSGSETMTFRGFGSYQFDAGTTWVCRGGEAVAANQLLTDDGTVSSIGTLVIHGTVDGAGTFEIDGGRANIIAGAAVLVANLALDGGTTSVKTSLSYGGAFSEGAGGTLTLESGDSLMLSGPSRLGGRVEGAGSVTVANATIDGLTFAGTDALTVTDAAVQTGDVIVGGSGTAVAALTIASGATWTIQDAAGMTHGSSTGSSLEVAGSLIKSGTSGTSTINVATADVGLIDVVTGTLHFATKVTGTGALRIDTGATLQLDDAAAQGLTVIFNGAAATLALNAPGTFAATISGFAVGDTIDILGTTATRASINASDQMVIDNGATEVATLQLQGTYGQASFSVSSDGHGGTDLTLRTAASAPPSMTVSLPAASAPHLQLIAAMAAQGPGAAHSAAPLGRLDPVAPSLLVPNAR